MVVRADLGISLDGFGTGEGQAQDAPFGHAGTRLLESYIGTATFHERVLKSTGGTRGVDDAFASRYFDGVGAEIMGANKFGSPGWHDDPKWQGWWGDVPPFHYPVFVLTHHPRPDLTLADTTFQFLDVSLEDALVAASDAAHGKDVRIGGGPTVVRDYLAAGLVDLLHVMIAPIVLGRGVRLWDSLEGLEAGYHVESVSAPDGVTHLSFQRR